MKVLAWVIFFLYLLFFFLKSIYFSVIE